MTVVTCYQVPTHFLYKNKNQTISNDCFRVATLYSMKETSNVTAQQHPNQERPQLPVEEIPCAPEAAGQLVGAALSFVHS